jgi:hypothetical protein
MVLRFAAKVRAVVQNSGIGSAHRDGSRRSGPARVLQLSTWRSDAETRWPGDPVTMGKYIQLNNRRVGIRIALP